MKRFQMVAFGLFGFGVGQADLFSTRSLSIFSVFICSLYSRRCSRQTIPQNNGYPPLRTCWENRVSFVLGTLSTLTSVVIATLYQGLLPCHKHLTDMPNCGGYLSGLQIPLFIGHCLLIFDCVAKVSSIFRWF